MAETAHTATAPLTQRVEFVDIARGIAMLCIILGHLGLAPVNQVVYTFHVPIFFLITGWFLSTKLEVAAFARKRARTLLVPYGVTAAVIVVGMLAIAVVKAASGAEPHVADTLTRWLLAALYGAGSDDAALPAGIHQIGALWFLWACFWGCVALRALLQLRREWVRALIVVAVFVLCVITAQALYLPLSLQSGGAALLFMYLGYLLKRYALPWVRTWPRAAVIAALALAAAGWVAFILSGSPVIIARCVVGRTPLALLGILCGCAIVMALAWAIGRLLPRLGHLLALVGKYSLIVLCVHVVELTFIKYGALIMWLGLPYPVAAAIALALKLAFILGVTWLLARWNPARRLFGFKPRRAGEAL